LYGGMKRARFVSDFYEGESDGRRCWDSTRAALRGAGSRTHETAAVRPQQSCGGSMPTLLLGAVGDHGARRTCTPGLRDSFAGAARFCSSGENAGVASRLIEPDRLDLGAPGWSRDIPRTAGELRTIQFSSLPPDSELDQLGTFIERHPEVTVRAYGGYDGSITDLEFLRHFRGARHVAIDSLFGLESLDGLRFLSDDLESLVLGQTKRRFTVGPLGRFRRLRRLYIEGHSKDIAVVSELAELQDLTFRSLTLPHLEILVPLRRLRALDIKLGGTTDLTPLSDMEQIEYLELWLIRGFDDLSEVSGLTRLRYLFLQALKQVTALPDLSSCQRLERIHLETMKGLTDLRPLRGAPRLRDLELVDMPQLRWEHLQPLIGHPTLQALRLGTGSKRRNAEFRARLGYPDTEAPSGELRRLSRGELD